MEYFRFQQKFVVIFLLNFRINEGRLRYYCYRLTQQKPYSSTVIGCFDTLISKIDTH